MEAWRKFSQWNWDKWASKLQPTYNRINDWKTPEWAKDACRSLWDTLDSKLKDKLYNLVFEICKRFDEAFAKKFIKDIMSKITKELGLKDEEDI